MPNGKTHDIITVVTAPIVGFTAYYLTKNIETVSILLGFYLFSSFMFNGDLDTNSAPYNRWWVFKMIWIPYQLMFHHRSVFTHGLIIGTIIRVIYIGIIPITILYFKGVNVLTYFTIEQIILALIGLELGSAMHTIADKVF